MSLKAPEGFSAEDLGFDKLTPLAKEFGLDSPKAQKLVELLAGHRKSWTESAGKKAAESARSEAEKSFLQKATDAVEKSHKEWVEALKADKEIGGEKLQASQQAAIKAAVRFGGDDLKKVLDETGLGNHPAVVRAFVKIGQAIAEDTVDPGASNGVKAAANALQAELRERYPTMYPKTS